MSNARKRGAVAVVVCVSLVVILGFASLAIDIGFIYAVKAHLQKSADASALAGAGVMFGPDGLDEYAIYSTAQEYVDLNESNPPVVEITIGEFIDGEFYESYSPETVNAVKVTVKRKEKLFFAPILGISETTISATAIAARTWLSSTCGIPVSLRTPGFGPVDYDVADANPGKDGPSYPSNGYRFQIGEPVLVFAFGKGPRPPVHLVLDLPQFMGVSETNKILGDKWDGDCGMLKIGDLVPVWNNGTGDGNFGEKLYDRLQDEDLSNDYIVIPIVETTINSHNYRGKLTGEVEIVDFVGVRLDEVVEEQVIDPRDPDKFLTIELLMGTVVPMNSHGQINENPSGYSYTVSSLRLVK